MSGNQVQIPVLQLDTQGLTQVQQNVNKVLNNLNNQIVTAQSAIDQMTILGEVKFSPLTLLQFQFVAGPEWILANGQSCVGTDYASTFKLNVVPTVTVAGVNSFIKVNNG